ncbi:hypothetical protein okayama3_18730 [Yersinia pseudotuberculosis]
MLARETIAIVNPVICIKLVFSFKMITDAINTATGILEKIIEARPELT